jgi:hypothetical protein
MALCLSGCRGEDSDRERERLLLQQFRSESFDYSESQKPTNAEMALVAEGMTFREVVQIIGKPHYKNPGLQFFWRTEEGCSYELLFCFSRIEGEITTMEDLDKCYILAGGPNLSYCPESQA